MVNLDQEALKVLCVVSRLGKIIHTNLDVGVFNKCLLKLKMSSGHS